MPKCLNVPAWERELQGDVDADFILEGVRYGFHIVDASHPPMTARMRNYSSATNAAAKPLVEAQIRDELAEGRYRVASEPPPIISALGAIPKSKPGAIRLIHDCSKPYIASWI